MHIANAKVSVFLRGTRISKSVSKNCRPFFQTFPPTSILSLIGQYHMYITISHLSLVEDTIEFWDYEIERNNLNLIIQKQMGLICKILLPGNPGTAQIVSLRDWELLNMPHFPTWKARVLWAPLSVFLIWGHSYQVETKWKWLLSGCSNWPSKVFSFWSNVLGSKVPDIFPFPLSLHVLHRVKGRETLLKERVILSWLSWSWVKNHCQGQWV